MRRLRLRLAARLPPQKDQCRRATLPPRRKRSGVAMSATIEETSLVVCLIEINLIQRTAQPMKIRMGPHAETFAIGPKRTVGGYRVGEALGVIALHPRPFRIAMKRAPYARRF